MVILNLIISGTLLKIYNSIPNILRYRLHNCTLYIDIQLSDYTSELTSSIYKISINIFDYSEYLELIYIFHN